MTRFLITWEGRVQGVGFRYFVLRTALKYELTGWVKNLDNGMVASEVQGSSKNLDAFIRHILKGNPFIRIDDYAIRSINLVTDEKKFKVIS
ncbi:MAG: acylphosphatase [Eubacteriaceae bacterium]